MLTLRAIDDAQLGALYECAMRRDFPPSELKSLSAILTMQRKGRYDVLGGYREDGALAAYALLYRPKDERAVLLDYLAVEPAFRGGGLGSKMLAQLRARYAATADVLIIECERPKAAPDEMEARRRIRFYTQAGARLTDVRIHLFDVEYSILTLPCGDEMPETDWAGFMLRLYSGMLPRPLFERHVRLIRG